MEVLIVLIIYLFLWTRFAQNKYKVADHGTCKFESIAVGEAVQFDYLWFTAICTVDLT